MATEKKTSDIINVAELLAVITQTTNFLPENERPDCQQISEDLKEQIKKSVERNGEFRGCRLLPFFGQKSAEWQFDYWMPENGDVLIASYPKTGTTWLREIVRNVLYKGDDEEMKITSKLRQPYQYIDATLPSLQEVYKQLPLKKRVWVTHLPAYCLNMERLKGRGVKIFYIMRNPKDQFVSWYNFRLELTPAFVGEEMQELHPADWDGFLRTHVAGQQCFFNRLGEWYPHHILSWYPYRNEKNVKFLYYEDLKKEPFSQVKSVAEFLEVRRSDEEIQEIVQSTSIASMKKRSKDEIDPSLVRKGMVGEWKDHFTVAQSELMDEKVNEALLDTDIRFTYTL